MGMSKDRERMARLILMSQQQIRTGLEGVNLALHMGEDVARGEDLALETLFGSDPSAMVLPRLSVEKLWQLIRALGHIYGFSMNLGEIPVLKVPVERGRHYAVLVDA